MNLPFSIPRGRLGSFALSMCLAVACASATFPSQRLCAADPQKPSAVESRRGIVVSVSADASQVGRDILAKGGTAVDAAVATALALAVTWPEAGNIGGGGFMMVMPPGKQVECIEYRETAPAAATERMFAPDESALTHKAVGVPGTIRGLALAHQRHGKLPWKELVAPAIRLAAEGYVLDEAAARSLNRVLAASEKFDELRRVYGKPRDPSRESKTAPRWKAGDRQVLPDLAATLRLIADEGADAFYRGKIAEQLVAEMARGKGLITRRDLENYQAKVREPIHGTFRGYDIYGPPPPSSGGICLVQMLNVLEKFPLARHGRNSPETAHLMAEAMRRAYCDRARYLGDADFIEIPKHLTSKEYAARLAASIDSNKATDSAALAPEITLAAGSDSTTHFSVIDASGMAVSNTYTLEQSYGARIVVRGAGFLLNNEMGDFNWQPGRTDRRGRIGTAANLIRPGKRMLSSQTPTIVAKDGKPVLITGSPGGRTIINTVLCVVLNVCEFKMDLPTAVNAPRMHHGWFPDRIILESRPGADEASERTLIEALRAKGHKVETTDRQGDAHSILIKNGLHQGYADPRISGKALPVAE